MVLACLDHFDVSSIYSISARAVLSHEPLIGS